MNTRLLIFIVKRYPSANFLIDYRNELPYQFVELLSKVIELDPSCNEMKRCSLES
jgi:hypothetical protein